MSRSLTLLPTRKEETICVDDADQLQLLGNDCEMRTLCCPGGLPYGPSMGYAVPSAYMRAACL